MLQNGRISSVQLTMILTLVVIGTTVLFAPGLSISVGGRDAWLAPIPAAVEGLVVCFSMLALSKRFPGQTPVEYGRVLFGKWFGTLFGVYMIWLIWRHYAVMLREFSDFTTTVALTRTPPEIIMLLMLAVIYYGVRQGVEVLARITQMVVLIELVQLVVSVVILAYKDVQIEHLYPLFEKGPMPFLRSSLLLMNWSGELIIIGFLLPSARMDKKIKSSIVYAMIGLTLLLMISDFFTLGVFGDVIAGRLQYGLYEVARYISIANFMERLDPIVMGVWIMLIYCKLAWFCYVTSLGLSQVLRMDDYRPLIGPVCLVGAIMSQQMFPYQASMTQFIQVIYPPYGLLIEFLGPPLLLLFAIIRGRRGARRVKNA